MNDPQAPHAAAAERPLLATLSYGTGAEHVWHPVVVFACWAAVVQGVIHLFDLLEFYWRLRAVDSNLLVQLAYLRWRDTAHAAATAGSGMCGALVFLCAFRCMRYRPRSRGQLLVLMAIALTCEVAEHVPQFMTSWSQLQYWTASQPMWLWLGMGKVVVDLVRLSIVPALVWVVLTRPAVVARFRGPESASS